MSSASAVLALEDGTVFHGRSIGAKGNTTGEVVFNTAMTGYQEILTDPSYCRQIVTLTYPHVGNTGTNAEDMESTAIYAAGFNSFATCRCYIQVARQRILGNVLTTRQSLLRLPISIRASSRAFCGKRARKPDASWRAIRSIRRLRCSRQKNFPA